MGLTEEQRKYYLSSHQELCNLLEKYTYGKPFPINIIIFKVELIPL